MAGTVRQLEVFAAVCRAQGFAAAAATLGISQVAVTRHIQALEQACGEALFDRRPGAVATLNRRGRELYARSSELLAFGEGPARHSGVRRTKLERFRVGADPTLLTTILAIGAESLSLREQGIDLVFEPVDPAPRMLQTLKSRKLDMAFITFPIDHISAEEAELITSYAAGTFASPKLLRACAWGGSRPKPLPVLLPPKGTALEESMQRVLAGAARGSYRVAAHVSYQSCLELASNGAGAILVSFYRAQHYLDNGVLREVTGFVPRQTVGRFVIRGRPLSSRGESLIHQLSGLIRVASTGSAAPVDRIQIDAPHHRRRGG